jgi:hypothetical protein
MFGEDSVHNACIKGDYNAFLANYKGVNAFTIYGASYLHYAYYGGNYMIIEHLERDCRRTLDFWGNSIYHYAALGGNYIPSDDKNNYDETPSLLLCKSGKKPIADNIYVTDKTGCNVLSYLTSHMMEMLDDIFTNKTPSNVLSQICRRDDLEIFKTILPYINVEYYLAIIFKYRAAKIIKHILENANTKISADIIFYILQEPYVIPIENEHGGLYSPPYNAYGTANKYEIVHMLCESDQLVELDNIKNTAYMAILMREYKLAKYLLIKYSTEQSGETLLAEAARESQTELVEYIINTYKALPDIFVERFYESQNYELLKKYVTCRNSNLKLHNKNNILIRAINDGKIHLVEFLARYIDKETYKYVSGLHISDVYQAMLDAYSSYGKIKIYHVTTEPGEIDDYGEECSIECDCIIECRDKNCKHGFSISAYISMYYIRNETKCPICRTLVSKTMIL